MRFYYRRGDPAPARKSFTLSQDLASSCRCFSGRFGSSSSKSLCTFSWDGFTLDKYQSNHPRKMGNFVKMPHIFTIFPKSLGGNTQDSFCTTECVGLLFAFLGH